jgi:hypothetical protein
MVFSHIAPRPALRDFVRDYLIAHFRFDREKPTVLKPYAPKPEQGITFFVRGRPKSVNPLTGEVQTATRVSILTKPPTAEEADRQFAAHAMKVVGPPLDVR